LQKRVKEFFLNLHYLLFFIDDKLKNTTLATAKDVSDYFVDLFNLL
jgi:hypothetical protein